MILSPWETIETIRIMNKLREARMLDKQSYVGMFNAMGVSQRGDVYEFPDGSKVTIK